MNLQRADNFESTDNGPAFSAWAQVYEDQPNPLLTLEERYLSRVLPVILGRDVLDAGCGTGRWLRRLANQSPRSICGIDSSADMLAVTRKTCVLKPTLIMAQLPMLPLISKSIDLAICSFVLSYLSGLQVFAREMRRVLRDGGDLLITDMHPDTAAALGWKRSFDVSGAHFDLLTHDRSLQEIKHAFEEQGFNVAALYQPTFGAPEIPIFVRGGKEESYTDTAGHPAIYILHLRAADTAMKSDFRLAHARIVLGKQEIDSGDISVANRRIASFISGGRKPSTEVSVDLSGYTLFPGLINAHDHLEFGLFPRLGRPPYKNATEWARDIQEKYAQTIQVHTAISRDVRLWWGALRNLLCGVTTVCHHNPPSPMLEAPEFPLHVVTKFDWAHSLAFSDDLQERHRKSAHPHPFVLHACEGIDEEARAEFAQLLEMKVVDERTVLVHGLAMTSQEISELNGCGASLIICPSSNDFLFGRAPVRDQLLNVKRLAIGSDSPLTARGDLLDEISFCCETLQICPEAIFDLVTSAPASILGLSDHAGSIAPDASADLFAVRSSVLPPARQLTCLRWHDVEFVMTGGVVRLASEQIVDRLPALLRSSLEPLSIDGVIRWIAAPVSSIFQAAADVLGTENVSLDGRRILLPAKPHAV